ncbi:chromate transporter [Sporosarcina sp. FA9]|uniref:chromate transporter n=1 Tax=Sporosarcina sp. FA9 TaxID=3413030 RepID=UPI003F65CE40
MVIKNESNELETELYEEENDISPLRLQSQIFLAFFRVGILGYGGGPASIPLVQKEVVEKYKWMDDEEFSDVLSLGNALPGPIATKMAGYIGWRVGGILGLLTAIFASIVPTIVLMIVFLNVLNAYKDKPWVQGISSAVVPVVGVMLGVITLEFIKSSKITLGWGQMLIVLIGSLITIEFLGIHPAIVIIVLLCYALLSPNKEKKK